VTADVAASVAAETANAPPKERDWSQVGKAPVAGAVAAPNRIASAAPGRPVASDASIEALFVPVAEAPAAAAATVDLTKPSDPASPT